MDGMAEAAKDKLLLVSLAAGQVRACLNFRNWLLAYAQSLLDLHEMRPKATFLNLHSCY